MSDYCPIFVRYYCPVLLSKYPQFHYSTFGQEKALNPARKSAVRLFDARSLIRWFSERNECVGVCHVVTNVMTND